MTIRPLSPEWESTRLALQGIAHATTALPRAGAPSDPRWGQVAMAVTETGLEAAPTPLEDGTELVSAIDLVNHRVVISAGDSVVEYDLTVGVSPRTVGEAIAEMATEHGSSIDVDESRYEDDSVGEYAAALAAEFFEVARSVVEAFNTINENVPGEVAGPHLWPHGFDIATEWYSDKMVDYDGTPTSAQIAIGWYPQGDAYFYANPWPFDESWANIELPAAASWNTEGWYGAKLDVSDLPANGATEAVVDLGETVHTIARDSLSA